VRHGGRNLEPVEVRSLKTDAVIGWSGLQRQRDFVAGMKADSGAGNWSAKGALRGHDLLFVSGELQSAQQSACQ
jgi:hypothetical protein